MKKLLLFSLTITALALSGYSQNLSIGASQSDERLLIFMNLPLKQLNDTAYYYYNKNIYDTALICFNLLINTLGKETDLATQKKIVNACNTLATIFTNLCDYRSAYNLLIKALQLSEKIDYKKTIPGIYLNMGNIYSHFNNQYEVTKSYYLKALNLCQDSTRMILILNNLGDLEQKNGNSDSALYFLNKALLIGNKYQENIYFGLVFGSLAATYVKKELYDSALYYYYQSINIIKQT